MKAKLSPDTGQIKYYAQAVLNSFETLNLKTAADVVQSNLRGLLDYLLGEESKSADGE